MKKINKQNYSYSDGLRIILGSMVTGVIVVMLFFGGKLMLDMIFFSYSRTFTIKDIVLVSFTISVLVLAVDKLANCIAKG